METVRRFAILTLLYVLPLKAAIRPVLDPDIWWHLRTGQWIIEHGTVPRLDPFSSFGMGKPWVAYSWLFEVIAYGLYKAFGLVGIVVLTAALSLSIAAALHRLVHRFSLSFGEEILLTAGGIGAIMPLFSPRPWLFTILFFIAELDLILLVRRSGKPQALWLLPPLFVLWANVHIQFCYGLFLLGLLVIEQLMERIPRHRPLGRTSKPIPLLPLLRVLGTCIAATFITPYHFHLYSTVIGYMRETGVFGIIMEFQPLGFRDLSSWFVLFIALGAAFSLGLRRDVSPFPLLVLIAGAVLSFRAVRDVWFIVATAVPVIATTRSSEVSPRFHPLTKRSVVLVSAALGIALVAIGWTREISEGRLVSAAAAQYPAAAATFVEERGYQGPLYNDFAWGGYLIWRLRSIPVNMDNRTNVHGDERIQRSVDTWAGLSGWDVDPELLSARLVIANVNAALTALLRLDSRFALVFEDNVAAVFIARKKEAVQ